jgi:cytoskeletal protein CcmA (bactofilin family)
MADEKVTIIDAQADIEGKMKGKDAVIHGRFRGEIALTGRVLIAEGARVEAAVAADALEVAGELKGDVRTRSFTLGEKARVQGTGEQSGKPAAAPLAPASVALSAPPPPAEKQPERPGPGTPPDKGDKAGA